jgi:response regulator RpfG family c-di-GMP phosphodiesterase
MQSQLSVLIVDDEEELAVLYEQFVRTIGYDAVSFTNPLLALEHYKQSVGKYSLIITDLRMPGMCGLELANRIRELDSNVKIFLITAFDIADIESKWAVGTAKIDKVLQKPIKFPLLKKTIDQNVIHKPENS